MLFAFPNESPDYRASRNSLQELDGQCGKLQAEIAADGSAELVPMSALFDGTNTLIVYSMMFGPEREAACPYCTAYLTNLDQAVGSLAGKATFVVAARSPVSRLTDYAGERGWRNLAMLSSGRTIYNVDYYGTDRASGEDQGIINVSVRDGDTIRHHWSSIEGDEPDSETYFDPLDPVANLHALIPAS